MNLAEKLHNITIKSYEEKLKYQQDKILYLLNEAATSSRSKITYSIPSIVWYDIIEWLQGEGLILTYGNSSEDNGRRQVWIEW